MLFSEDIDRVVWRLPVVDAPEGPTLPLLGELRALDREALNGLLAVGAIVLMAVAVLSVWVVASGLLGWLASQALLSGVTAGLLGLVALYTGIRRTTAATLVCVVELYPTELKLSIDAPEAVGDMLGAVSHGVPLAIAEGIAFDWAELTHAHIHPGPTLEFRTDGGREFSIPIHGARSVPDQLRRLQKQLDAHRKGKRGRAPAALEKLRQ